MNNKDIVKRYDALFTERRGSVEQIWELIERFVLPLRGEFYATLNDEHEVDWHRREVYDSTAVFAAQSLAASIHGNLTSASQKWFELKFRAKNLNDIDEFKIWLEDVTNIIYSAINNSNFDVEIAEAYLDLVGYGTACLICELDDDGLNFSAVSIRDLYFEENHKKQVDKFYRRIQWTPAQIISKFGDNVPARIAKLAEDSSAAHQKIEIIFCIYPRESKKDIDLGKPLAAKSRPFGYKYVLKGGAEMVGEEGGYYEMPAYVARWRKTAGSKWGHSPAAFTMGDILTLNQVKEATLEAAAKAIDPPSLVEEDNLVGDLDLQRGGMSVVRDKDGIRVYESGSRFDVSNLEISMLTESIQKAFFQDQLQLKESPAMTATEASIRYELMQRLMGPSFARVKTDLLDPLIQRVFNILYREGKLPELPSGLTSSEMDIEYTGPLARSQKKDTADAIQGYILRSAEISQVLPEALDSIDIDKAQAEIASLEGVPVNVLRGRDEIDKIRKSRQRQQQAQQQMESAQQMGGAMEQIGKGGQAMGEVDPAMMEAMAQQ